jgi:hypothetical protein
VGGCRFAIYVSSGDRVTCGDARCLTRCHLAFVSNLCHFSATVSRSRIFAGRLHGPGLADPVHFVTVTPLVTARQFEPILSN